MLWAIPDIAIIGGGYFIASLDVGESTIIPPIIQVVETGGYYEPGDGGGGLYTKALVEPAHPGKFQSANGVWWELKTGNPNLRQLGAKLDGATNDTQAFEDLYDYIVAMDCPEGDFGSGSTIVTRQINWPPNVLLNVGELVIDASTGAAIDFPDGAVFYCYGGDLTQIADFNANVAYNQQDVTFAAPVNLTQGRMVVVYNPTNKSFNTARDEYRAGETLTVARVVSNSRVVLKRPLQASYVAANVDCYLKADATFKMNCGALTIISNNLINYVFELYRCNNNHVENLTTYNGAVAGVLIRECYNGILDNINITQTNTGSGSDYGLSYANSEQHVATGNFRGRRHAVSQGGFNQVGCIPCRYNEAHGVFQSEDVAVGGDLACDAHGNAVHYYYSGTAYGGVVCSGNYGKFRGTIYAHPAYPGIYVSTECIGCTFDFNGVEIHDGGGNNAGFGLISGDGFGATLQEGGVLDFGNMKIYSPNQQRVIICRNNGFTVAGNVSINLAGTVIQSANATCIMTFDNPAGGGGRAWSSINAQGFVYPTNTTFGGVTAVDRIYGWEFNISKDVTIGAPAAVVDFIQAYTSLPFGKTPIVTASLGETVTSGTTGGYLTNTFGNNLQMQTSLLMTVNTTLVPAGTYTVNFHAAL